MAASNTVSTNNSLYNGPLRWMGHLFSTLFHPLFIPLYVGFFLLYIQPGEALSLSERSKPFVLAGVFFSTAFLPAFSVFLMKQLGFIESIFLRTQKDRIIPYITSMIFFFWIWYVSKNQPHHPPTLTAFLLATFISTICALMANIYFKISMHAIAAGAFWLFFIWYTLSHTSSGLYLAVATIIAGLICTSRFLVSDHKTIEIYSGLIIGILCQAAAIGIVF